MNIVRRVQRGENKAVQFQFLHRAVSEDKLKRLRECLDLELLKRVISMAATKDELGVSQMEQLKNMFFQHVDENLKSALVILSIAATHSYYNSAYVKRKSYDEELVGKYARDILDSVDSALLQVQDSKALFI
jgi:hypothetical protein